MKKLILAICLLCFTSFTWAGSPCDESLRPSHEIVVQKIRGLVERSNENLFNDIQAEAELDRLIGYDIRGVEDKIKKRAPKGKPLSDQEESHLGQAKWSGGNPNNGWATNYRYLVSLYEILDLQPGQRIVDIGSAHGRPGIVLGFLHPDVEYLGYEIVPERVRSAQEIANAYKLSNVTFKQQDLSAPDFKIAPADFYYLYDPVNDQTLRFLIDRMLEANGDRDFKIILKLGGGGEYEKILSDRFPRSANVSLPSGIAFIFDSKLHR